MPIGGKNPCSFRVGGGPTLVQSIEKSLTDLVGSGGSAEPGTLEAEWRLAKARGLAASASGDERAMNQAFPDRATDAIPGYESLLNISPAPDATEQERRDEIVDLWTVDPDAAVVSLEQELQKIDPAFSVVEPNPDLTRHVKTFGRAFGPFQPVPTNPEFFPSESRNESRVPNFSDDLILDVEFLIVGSFTKTVEETISKAGDLLNLRLPSWVGFRMITGNGFFLDSSPLDVTTFDSGDTPSGVPALLLESGDDLLLESGDRILLE